MSRIKRRPGEDFQLPIIGKLKCGYKPEGKKYPVSTDYFIPSGLGAESFRKKYGDKATKIPIVFLYSGNEKQCEERYEYRDNSGSLYAYGDGELFYVWDKNEYKLFLKDDFPEIMQKVHEKVGNPKGWSVTLTLRFVIPTLKVLGRWQLTTKGEASSIPNIIAAYDTIEEHNGTVKGILFNLCVSFAKSQKPGEKSRYPVVTLVPNNDPDDIADIRTDLLSHKKLLNLNQ